MERLTDALYAVAGEPPGDDPRAARRRLAVIAVRRALHNRRRVPEDQLAAARLPEGLAAAVAGHLAGRAERETLSKAYERAWSEDLREARRALLALAGSPVFREGIRLVSRSLLERLRSLERADPGRWRHDERHAGAKLTAYAGRFATKTSPNSVFCATALAWIGGEEARVSGGDPAGASGRIALRGGGPKGRGLRGSRSRRLAGDRSPRQSDPAERGRRLDLLAPHLATPGERSGGASPAPRRSRFSTSSSRRRRRGSPSPLSSPRSPAAMGSESRS